MQFSQLIRNMPPMEPIFVKGRVFNSTINSRLKVLCKRAQIPVITVHSLRHTCLAIIICWCFNCQRSDSASHSSMTTTQETYLHIIQELENQDNDKIMRHLAMLM